LTKKEREALNKRAERRIKEVKAEIGLNRLLDMLSALKVSNAADEVFAQDLVQFINDRRVVRK